MKTLQAAAAASAAVEVLVGRTPEGSSRCEPSASGFEVHVEVLETKGRLSDNDILATFMVRLDTVGDVIAYERIRRYTRGGQLLAAG